VLKRLHTGVISQESLQEFFGTLGRQGVEAELHVVGLRAPTVLVLGPVVHQEEHLGRGQAVQEAVKKRLRSRIDPMQIFTEQEQRLHLTLAQ
jgi:hypothetical protein